jgi:hypothetical protein
MPVAQFVDPPRNTQLLIVGKKLINWTASNGSMLAIESRAFQPPTGAGIDATRAAVR